jgi:hypothetical protein
MIQNTKMNGLEGMLKKSFPDDDKTLRDRDIEKEKHELISMLKNLKKEDMVSKPKKYTIWSRIMKVMGL